MIIDSTSGNPDLERNFIRFQSRPTAFEFYFKGYPAKQDTNAMIAVLSKWNPQANKRDTVASANWTNGDTVSQYTKATAWFEYFSSETPDSISILISSSLDGFSPKIGSKLYIDNISMNYSPNSLAENKKTEVSIYPNPANTSINILSKESLSKASLYDISGRLVTEELLNSPHTTLETSNLREGAYILKLTNRWGSVQTEKILIKH